MYFPHDAENRMTSMQFTDDSSVLHRKEYATAAMIWLPSSVRITMVR